MILVTANEIPDLDGSACAYAYAELLNKLNKKAKPVVFDLPHREALFVFDYLKIKPNQGEKLLKKSDQIILTDASETAGLYKKINPDQVIEIIDHRRDNAKEKFRNAETQIELVGACATLITEKFIKEKINPSRESAILLYLAIVSNTINFKNKITTSRDKNAAKYLKQLYKIDKNLIHQMFLHKSDLSDKTIEELFEEDRFVNIHAGKRFTIFQLEIAEVEKFISQNKEEIILELEKVKIGEKAVIVFLSCIDLERAENTFVTSDRSTQKFLSQTFGVKFENQIARHKGIIMRKEIVPLVKQYLSKYE